MKEMQDIKRAEMDKLVERKESLIKKIAETKKTLFLEMQELTTIFEQDDKYGQEQVMKTAQTLTNQLAYQNGQYDKVFHQLELVTSQWTYCKSNIVHETLVGQIKEEELAK